MAELGNWQSQLGEHMSIIKNEQDDKQKRKKQQDQQDDRDREMGSDNDM